MNNCVVCDIDEVIVGLDREINFDIVNIIKNIPYEIIFVTCRPEKLRQITTDLLLGLFVPVGKLFMRKNDDDRSHWRIKQDIIREIQKEYKILFAIDDKNSVVKMYRKNKINCLQVNFENDKLRQPHERDRVSP